MARATVFNSAGPLTAPAAGATLAAINVATAQAAGWQAGTWFYYQIDMFIDGTGVPATDDDNTKLLINGGSLATHLSVNGNGAAAGGGFPSRFSGNAQWNGVNLPLQFETLAAGSAAAVYHATVSATAIDTQDDLPSD